MLPNLWSTKACKQMTQEGVSSGHLMRRLHPWPSIIHNVSIYHIQPEFKLGISDFLCLNLTPRGIHRPERHRGASSGAWRRSAGLTTNTNSLSVNLSNMSAVISIHSSNFLYFIILVRSNQTWAEPPSTTSLETCRSTILLKQGQAHNPIRLLMLCFMHVSTIVIWI